MGLVKYKIVYTFGNILAGAAQRGLHGGIVARGPPVAHSWAEQNKNSFQNTLPQNVYVHCTVLVKAKTIEPVGVVRRDTITWWKLSS